MDISHILKDYDLSNVTLGVLGGHSALDVCAGAKKHGIRTVCVAKKGREETYAKHYKTRKVGNREIGCIDELIVVDDFKDIVNDDVQQKLRNLNTLFVHNRYFWTYCDFKNTETQFQVPIYGSRELLKLEERDIEKNQYYLLEQANIRLPKIYKTPKLKLEGNSLHITHEDENHEEIDGLTLTKVNNAIRTYERENFVASSWAEWILIAEEKIEKGEITLEALQDSVIEEFVLGAQINFNFFRSMVTGEIELMGTDMRRQTSLDGWLRLPAREQMKIPEHVRPHHIETGHVAITCKESIIEKAYKAAEDFVDACKREGHELIGAFALQGAIQTDGKKEEVLVFDVSMRIPGSPGIMATPYTGYLHGENMSMGERIAIEIKEAQEAGIIKDLLT